MISHQTKSGFGNELVAFKLDLLSEISLAMKVDRTDTKKAEKEREKAQKAAQREKEKAGREAGKVKKNAADSARYRLDLHA